MLITLAHLIRILISAAAEAIRIDCRPEAVLILIA